MKNSLLMPILVLLASCAGSELVREDVGDYDLNEYLVGTGVADNEAGAKQRARSDLAKIFEIEVKEDTSDKSEFKSGVKGINKNWQINRNISTYTNKVLNGVQIASVKKDEKTAQYRAVAILPRSQASSSLRQQINQIDADINRHLSSASSTNDKLQSIRFYYQALQKQKQRDELQKALVVIDVDGKGLPSTLSLNQIAQKLSNAIKRINISVTVNGKAAINIGKVVSSALANVGATVVNEGAFVLQTAIKVHDLGIIQDWNWYKSLVSLTLNDLNRRPLAQKQVTVKVAALDKGSAKLKLEKKLQSQTEKALLNMLLGK